MKSELVSVIIPVYNVETFLGKCIESVLAQTYGNLEIILIDDGSKDNSGKICDEYALIDNRVICVHQKNGGVSNARNAGLSLMRGKYVTFIDSDDYVDRKYVETLYSALKENNVLLSISNYMKVYDGKNTYIPAEHYQTKVFDKKSALYALFHSDYKYQFTMAVGKLYDSSLFSNIRFPEGQNYEDTAIAYKFIECVENLVYIDRKQYFYLTRENSITHSEKFVNNNLIDVVYDRVNYLKKKQYGDLWILAEYEYLTTTMGVWARLDTTLLDKKRRLRDDIISNYKENKAYLKSKLFKMRFFIFLYFPRLYSLIINGLSRQRMK